MTIVPIAFLNTKKNQISEIDNRYLVEIEGFNTDEIESYLMDRIGFRKDAIKIYSKINSSLFDKLTNGVYMYCKNKNEAMVNITNITRYGDYHDSFINALERINEYCEERGKKFYFVLNPTKANVYPEKIIDGINYNNDWIYEFVSRIKDKNINIIDNVSYFNEIKSNDDIYNEKYDIYHWSDNGAFLGTNNLLHIINKDFSNVCENSKEDYLIEKNMKSKLIMVLKK